MTTDAHSVAPEQLAQTRPWYWSVRRELWENRFVYIAPIVMAAFVLLGTLIAVGKLPKKVRAAEPAKQESVIRKPFSMAPAPIMMLTILVGFFYCFDALHGERRDLSILFYKSLPVSDLTTVLAKASIPLLVLPLIGLALSLIVQAILLMFGNMVFAANGISPARLWSAFGGLEEPIVMVYGLSAFTLWHAPIHGYLLLVSAWAKRTPMIWAVLPLVAIGLFERMFFGTKYFAQFMGYRFGGAMSTAFKPNDGHVEFGHLDPIRYLGTPGLWAGLIFAGACLAMAARLRRHREPI